MWGQLQPLIETPSYPLPPHLIPDLNDIKYTETNMIFSNRMHDYYVYVMSEKVCRVHNQGFILGGGWLINCFIMSGLTVLGNIDASILDYIIMYFGFPILKMLPLTYAVTYGADIEMLIFIQDSMGVDLGYFLDQMKMDPDQVANKVFDRELYFKIQLSFYNYNHIDLAKMEFNKSPESGPADYCVIFGI